MVFIPLITAIILQESLAKYLLSLTLNILLIDLLYVRLNNEFVGCFFLHLIICGLQKSYLVS